MTIVIMHIISKSIGTYGRRTTPWDRSAYIMHAHLDYIRDWVRPCYPPQSQNSRGAEKERRIAKGEEGNYSQLSEAPEKESGAPKEA